MATVKAEARAEARSTCSCEIQAAELMCPASAAGRRSAAEVGSGSRRRSSADPGPRLSPLRRRADPPRFPPFWRQKGRAAAAELSGEARRIPTSRCTDKEGRRKKKNLTYGPML